MTDPDTAALAERVRQALNRLACDGPVTQAEYVGPADAALTTLVEGVEAAERHVVAAEWAMTQHAEWHRAAEAEVGRLREALTLTYASIDNLCARPGTCMAVRPRAALRDTASGK